MVRSWPPGIHMFLDAERGGVVGRRKEERTLGERFNAENRFRRQIRDGSRTGSTFTR